MFERSKPNIDLPPPHTPTHTHTKTRHSQSPELPPKHTRVPKFETLGSSVVTSTSNDAYASAMKRQMNTTSDSSCSVSAALASPSVLYGGVVIVPELHTELVVVQPRKAR